MSHFTKVATQMSDMEAIKNALSNMGLSMVEHGQCRKYAASEFKANVVKLPGPYDMALAQNSDGTFSIEADYWGGHVAKVIGQNGSTLYYQYAIEKLKLEAAKKKYKCMPVKDQRGKFMIYDPLDTSAKLEATVSDAGEVSFKAIGFKGTGCMKFAGLEEALGKSKRTLTPDYYQEAERERVKIN